MRRDILFFCSMEVKKEHSFHQYGGENYGKSSRVLFANTGQRLLMDYRNSNQLSVSLP